MAKPLRVPVEGLGAGTLEIRGAAARYISRVHRLGPGAALCLFDPLRALEAEARVTEVGADRVCCLVEAPRESSYEPYPITLIAALAKGAKPDLTLRDATALGVARVVFADAERSVVHVPVERAPARAERWQRIAAEAARQSGRGDVPAIEGPMQLTRALDARPEPLRLVLSAAGEPLLGVLESWSSGVPLALLVGPEGGLSPEEMAAAAARDFLPASLGPTTLRSELASIAALAALVAFAVARGIRR